VAAANRALETELSHALYRDPFARDLAGEDGWSAMRTVRSTIWPGTVVGPEPYLSITTRFFDDALRRVVRDSSITQVVILGAGMDTRALRLEWPGGIVLFELDRDEVFERKETILRRLQARPACHRRIVKTDLTRSWGSALLKAGFDPHRKAAILAESLFLYLDESAVEQIFTALRGLASAGSWIGLDVISADTLGSAMMTPYLNKLNQLGRAPWRFGLNDPETLLAAHGWEATALVFGAPEASYGRWPYPYVPRGTPTIHRAFLIQGWMGGKEGVWRGSR
jgi:methyltransferase (TIGR00027 family)